MVSKITLLKSFLLGVVLVATTMVSGQTNGDYRTKVASGNWNTSATWEVYSSGWIAATDYPGQNGGAGEVSILSGATISFNATLTNPIGSLNVVGSLDLYTGTIIVNGATAILGNLTDSSNTGTNTFGGPFTVAGSGSFSTANTSTFIFKNGIVNNGTFSKTGYGSVTFNTNSQSITGNELTLNASSIYVDTKTTPTNITLTIDADVTINCSAHLYNYSNAAVAMQMNSGTFNLTTSGTQYLNFDGGTGRVVFNMLNVASTGIKQARGPITLNNNLVLNTGQSFDIYTSDFIVNGTTTIDGALTETSNTGSNIFKGLFKVNVGGSYVNNVTSINEFQNGIENYGDLRIYNASTTINFTKKSQNIIGDKPVTLAGTITVADGLTLTNKITDVTDGLVLTGTMNGASAASAFANEQLLSVRGTNGPMLTSGTFDVSTVNNMVRYQGNLVQNITPVSYYNLNVESTNDSDKYLQGNTTVTNNFVLNNRADLFPVSYNFTVLGHSYINGRIYDQDVAGVLSFQDVDLSNGEITGAQTGNFVINGNLTMPTAYGRLGRGNITINGTTDIASGSNLTLNNTTGAKIFNGKITANGDWINTGNTSLEIRNGFEFNGATFTSGSGAYNFTINNQSFTTASAVTFSGAVTIGNGITLTNNNTNAISGTTINGVLNGSNAGSTFDNRGIVTYLNGTEPMAIGVLNCSNTPNTFNYNRNTTQYIKGTTYDVLQITNAGAKSFYGDVSALSSFETSGTVNVNCNNFSLTLGGANSLLSSGTFTTNVGKSVIYNGLANQNMMSIAYKGDLIASGSGIKSMTGSFAVDGNITINSGSGFKVADNITLTLANNSIVTNNGTLQVVGSSGNPATIVGSGLVGYQINQANAAAQFHAAYAAFDALSGITITDGIIDATNNFSHCIFSNGTGSEYLDLTNYNPVGGFTDVQNVVFGAGSTNNVTRTSGTDAITFVAATGTLAGENYDKDNANPGTLIEWTDPSSVYYSTGNVSAYAATSWRSNQDGTGGSPTLARLQDGTLTLIVQDGHTVTLDNNGNINARKLIVGEGISGGFLIGGDATQQTLTVQELIEVNEGAVLEPGSSGAPAHILSLYGNMVNNGTVNLRKSFTQLVNTRVYGNMIFGGANTPMFSQLTFESGANATAQVDLDVNWNLILQAGATFNDGGRNHKVEYNWVNNGGTYNSTGGLEFDGGTSSITSSGTTTTFNDVTFSGGGLVTVKENVIFNGNFLANNNTRVSVDNVSVTVNGNYTVEAGAQYIQTANYTYFDGTNAQTITLRGSSSFNRVVFNNGGVNAKTIVGDFDISNWMMINNGATVDGAGDHVISGGLRVNGTCNFSGSITMKGGSIDTDDATVSAFTLGTAKLNIENTVYLRHSATGGSVTVTVQNDVLVRESGALVIDEDAVLVGQLANTLTLEANRNLYIRGADNFPDGFGTYNFDPTANVFYDADVNQTIRGGFTYGRLYISNANTKTVDGPISITGHLYLRTGATLDLQSFSHIFSGSNIYNDTNHNGSINGSNATLTISVPDANQTIQATGTGTYTLKNLILSQNGATATRTTTFDKGCKLTITGDLTMENVGGTEAIEYNINLNDNPIQGPAQNLTLGAYCWLNVNHLNFGLDVIDNFTTTSFDVNSTVHYSLNGGNPTNSTIDPTKNQIIAHGVIYGNLALYQGNKIAEGNLDINGDIFNTSTAEFYDGGFTHNLAGNWKLNSTNYYTQRSATGTIIFDGEDQDVDGSNFNNLTIANSGAANLFGNLDIFGDIIVNDGSEFKASTLNMAIGGDVLVLGAGKYTQTDGTTTLNGNNNQSITMNAASNFGNLTINKTNPLAQTVAALSDIHIGNDLTVSAMSGIFDISNRHLYIGDDLWVNYNTGVQNFITTGSTVVFNGTTAQEIRSYHEDNLVFNNLTFEGSGDKTLSYGNPGGGLLGAQNFEVNGNFTINSSVVEGNSVSLYARGNWLNNGTFNHGRTVYFDGANQTIGASGFNHVSFQGSDTKTLIGNISVSYDIYIDSTATLDANGNNITLGRTWYNNVDGARYVHGNGKVVFNGAHGANIYTGTTSGSMPGKDFYAIDVNKTNTGYVSLQGDLIVQNDLNINSQILHTYGNDVWVGGNFVVKGTYNCNNDASLLTLNASGGTHVFDPNDALIRGLEINAPGASYQLHSGFTLSGSDMTMTAGTLDLNKNQIQVNDYNRKIDINGGSMIVGPASKVLFTNAQSINLIDGELHISGETGITANLENTHTTNGFIVNATGGTIFADHYRLQKGSIVVNGATLDATQNLSNGTFVEGVAGSSYITLTGVDLGSGISLSNMIFNSGASKNISRTSGAGTVTVLDASGGMAGAYFEEDDGIPGTLIDWTFPLGFFWDGNSSEANTNWHDALNWTGNTVPSASDIVYINHNELSGNYSVNISSADAPCMRLVMDTQGGNPIGVTVGAGRTLDVTEHVAIGVGATLTQADNTAIINVGKNWTNQGAYIHNNAKVIFNATAGNFIISSGGIGAGKSFYDLTIDAGTSLYTLDMPTDIQNNLTVSGGTFDLASPNNDITVGGNWHIDQSNGGIFVSNTADVTFNGTSQAIKNGVFYNLIIGATSTTALSSNIAIENDITLNDGSTFNANDRNIYVRGNWQNNHGTFLQTGLGNVIFDKTGGTQYVDNGTHGTLFNNLIFSNSAAKIFVNDVSVYGNVLINDGAGVVNLDTYVLNGIGVDNKFACNEYLQIQGVDNFPSGFESVEFSDASLVRYWADVDQNIYPTTYGGLSLQRLTDSEELSVKTTQGNIEITGSLYLNSVNRPVELNMAANDVNMVLTGSIDLRGASLITWGTGNATLEHVGAVWNIDEDIPSFNHLILGGTGDKYTQGNLSITGDLTIKSNVDLMMYATSGRNDFRTVSGTSAGTVSMETGARILNTRPSLAVDAENGGPAIPEGFGSYDFNENSSYLVYSDRVDQSVFTGSNIAYGNLIFYTDKNVTGDGIADLDVNGDWNISDATYHDGGKDMFVAGSNVYFNNYVPSSADRKLVLKGLRDQRIYDSNDNLMELPNVEFRGTGNKSIIDHTLVNGNLLVDAGVTLQTGYNITFNGSDWVNKGFYQQTGNGLTFSGVVDQTIDPGMLNAENYFNVLVFDGTGTKTFVNNGADVNNAFIINEGTVDLGNLDYFLSNKLDNILGGEFLSANANITLDGGNQHINSPNFAVGNITCSGNGTKYLYSDWKIGSDLTIESGVALSTQTTVLGVTTDYNIFIGGDWNNKGTFYDYTGKVIFNGNLSPITISSGGSNFYDVEFAPTAPVNYSLLSPVTNFQNQMNIEANAELNLNSQTLNLGRNSTGSVTHTINGTLTVDGNAILNVNNHSAQSVLEVYGALNIVGSDESHVATLTSETTQSNYNKTQVNVHPGATMAARYYLIEYIADAGLNLMSGSTLHPVNNFSDGTFLNMRDVAGARYITLESNYNGASISNVSFSYDGMPAQGRHFNVQRKLTAPAITFDNVTGSIGNYRFEDDDQLLPAFNDGLILWPEITETRWIGSVDNDWHKAGNWDNGVPTATMDAIIADKDNDPIIFAANAECKSLIISDGTLRVEDDMDMVVHDNVSVDQGVLYVNAAGSSINVKGDWTINTQGNFVHGNGTVTFDSPNGYAYIAPGTSDFYNLIFNNAITTFNISASELNVHGDLTIYNGIVSPSTNNYVYNLYGDYLITGGSFDAAGANGGTIVLKADGNQTVTNASFNNLNVAGLGNKNFAGVNTVEGLTKIISSLVAQTGSAILFKGDMTIDAAGTFNDGGASHEFQGANWRGNGNYVGAGTITFSSTTNNQYLHKSAFNNLVVDCTGRVLYLEADVNINGNLTFKSGVSQVNLQTSTFTSSGLGVFTVESDVVTYVYGADNFPKSFASYNMDATSDTRYYASFNQNVAGVSYGILRLNNISTKTLNGNAEVKGNLYFNNSTLDVSINNYSLTLGGHWYNNNADGGNFICREGEVVFNGADNQNIYTGDNNGNDFYDLSVNASAQVSAANPTNNDFIIKNNLNVTGGVFNANGRTIYVGGDLMAAGAGTFNNNTGTYYLNKASGSANIGFNGSSLYSVTINSGATYTVRDKGKLIGSLILTSGVLDGNGQKIDIGNGSGDVVSINGTYIVGAGGVLGLGNGTTCTVGASGRIEVVGSSAGLAKVSNNVSGGRYGFVVNGEIAAEYYMFEYMSNVGIYLTSTSTIDAAHHFSNGTFSNGATTGQLFRVENTQSFNQAQGNRIEKVSFPVHPGGSASNVAKYEGNSGELEFYNSVGVFAGENFDNDTRNLINWTGPVHLTWNGLVDTNWNNSNNWSASSGSPIVPTSENNVFIPGGLVNYPDLSISGQRSGNLTIEQGAEITINTVAGDIEPDLNVDGDFTIRGTLSTGSSNDLITVEGNWTAASGAVVLLNGKVTFDGAGGAKQIDNGGNGFYALTIAGTTQYQIAGDIKIKTDMTIEAGSAFDASPTNSTITVGGDWQNNGAFLAQQGTVVLKSTPGTRSIRAGISDFYNMQINSSGTTYNLIGDMGVDEMLQIQKGTLDVKTNTLKIGDGSGIDGVSISGTLLINAGATLDMGNSASLNVNADGSMELLGDDKDSRATLTSSSAGRYSFDVNSGGSIKASYYNVYYTDADGLHMHAGANIDPTYNLSDGIFSNGFPGSGSYMTLMHNMATPTFTLSNLVFNVGPNYSVTRTAGTTIFYFEDATGVLGNYLYERDEEAVPSPSSGLLRWPFEKLYTWEGDVDSDWLNPANWFDDQLPVSTSDITIPNVGFKPVINNSQVQTMQGLTIQNGATVTVQPGSKLTINGDLTTNDGLIVKNTVAQPVSIITKGTVTGKAEYQWDNLTTGKWWHMAHPVSGVTEDEYQASFNPDRYAVEKYTTRAEGWRRIAGKSSDVAIYSFDDDQVMEGYNVYTGDKQLLKYAGVLNNKPHYERDYTGVQWYHVGNPYPSYIDVENSGFDLGTMSPTVYIRKYDNSVSSYNILTHTPVNEGSRYVSPGQAMWLKTYSNFNTISIDKTARTHTSGGYGLKSSSVEPNDRLRLALQSDFGTDESVVIFNQNGSDIYTAYDSEKLMNGGNIANLYSLKGGKNVAINSLPELSSGTVVPLAYQVAAKGMGDMTIKATNLGDFMPEVEVYLEDKVAGVSVDLRETPSYTFTPSIASATDRFELRFKTSISTAVDEDIKESVTKNQVLIYGLKQKAHVKVDEELLNGIDRTITVYNVAGQLMATYELNSAETEFDLPQRNAAFIIRVNIDGVANKAIVIGMD